ncbi:MAG: hypothetical protein ABI693_14240 [Bryobacteraceae bacterium]
MRRLTGIVLSLLVFPELVGTEARWIEMHIDNFRAYSSAGARATRDTLRHFEQVRASRKRPAPICRRG